jgi:hypothetical protein
MALVVLAWALIRHPWPSPARALASLGAGLAIAGSSYAYAGLIAGNPLLPMFNRWFRSPYFPLADLADNRWHAGFGGDLLWKMTFDTDHYLEAHKGAAGFMLVALCGLWLLSFFRRDTRATAIVATTVLLLPLIPMQYLRYAYPGFVLLCAVLAATAGSAEGGHRYSWLLIGVCLLNLGFQANSNWILRQGALKQTLKALGRDAPVMARFAPERVLAAAIRDAGDTSGNVLLLDTRDAFFAEFGSRGRSVSWYSPRLDAAAIQAGQDASGEAWIELLRCQNVRHVILRSATVTPAQMQALRSVGAIRRATVAETEWWELPSAGATP